MSVQATLWRSNSSQNQRVSLNRPSTTSKYLSNQLGRCGSHLAQIMDLWWSQWIQKKDRLNWESQALNGPINELPHHSRILMKPIWPNPFTCPNSKTIILLNSTISSRRNTTPCTTCSIARTTTHRWEWIHKPWTSSITPTPLNVMCLTCISRMIRTCLTNSVWKWLNSMQSCRRSLINSYSRRKLTWQKWSWSRLAWGQLRTPSTRSTPAVELIST